MSHEQKKYLKKIKLHKYTILFFQLLILILFFYGWQYLADHNIINSFITSSPKKIINTIYNLYINKNLFEHIYITTYETIISFILSFIIGFTIAMILWFKKSIAEVLEPYFTILNSLPKVALGPVILVWGGANIKSIIIMAILVSVVITIINIYQAFINVDKNKIKLMKSFKASNWQTFRILIIPHSQNAILSTLKISISMSLIGVIMGEFLVSKKGIGYLIMYGSQVFNLNLVMSGILLLCILASILYYLIDYLEKKITKRDFK